MIYDRWDVLLISLFMFGLGLIFGYAWGNFNGRFDKGEQS